MGPMRVVSIAAECEPWAKSGGLGDVVDALARALGQVPGGRVEPVDVFLPRYRSVPVPEAARAGPVLRVRDPRAPGGVSEVSIVEIATDGYRLRLVDHPAAFDRDGYYGEPGGGDYPDNGWRFGLFCRAALEALRADGRPVDVLNLHDWHAAPAAIYRDRAYADDPVVGRAAVLVTLHNLAYHGWVPPERVPDLGLGRAASAVASKGGGIDLLAAGVRAAELANTVSPGFAREALTPAFGMGLDVLLGEKGDRFVGILNGLDTRLWDPATDPALAAPYSRGDRVGKAACRADLLRRNGFDPDDDGPVLGTIGRLDPQKGFDLIAGMTERFVAGGGRLIVQGSGDPSLAQPFRRSAARWPDRVALIERFDRQMARRIYAGADFFAMPSRFEPCGQGQMIALRYGTPPIVRRTGGLADTVVDADEHPTAGTGFVFDEASADALLAACRRATASRERGGPAWEGLLDRGMAADFDWRSSAAPRYIEACERAIAIRRGATAR
jgi:starch synthase